jgi:hypothetical protein
MGLALTGNCKDVQTGPMPSIEFQWIGHSGKGKGEWASVRYVEHNARRSGATEKSERIAQMLKILARILLYKKRIIKENGQLSVNSEILYGCGIFKLAACKQ